MEHELKTWPVYYRAIVGGLKSFEIRKNDRDFQVGDTLLLREYRPLVEQYTGDESRYRVTCVVENKDFGIRDGYCVMGIARLRSTLSTAEAETKLWKLRVDEACDIIDGNVSRINAAEAEIERLKAELAHSAVKEIVALRAEIEANAAKYFDLREERDSLLAEVSRLKSESRWIPVSQPPEKPGHYIVDFSYSFINDKREAVSCHWDGKEWSVATQNRIYAWMPFPRVSPLPPAPAEGEAKP